MTTITLDPQKRTGTASGPLVALQDNALTLTGADLPAGAEVALLTKGGIVLAAATTADAEGHATLPCATRQVADATRNLPLGQAFPAFLAVGLPDGLVAALPIDLLPNKLPALAAHPPAPLPAYWTAEQTQAAIAEAVAGLASEADVDSKIAAHNAAADAHEDIREKLADKAEISELVTETEAREQGDADTLDAAKAYADGKVETEAQTRKAQDAETLASAKEYADGKVAGAYRYKGTVATVDDLPASGNAEGDVWNVSADGMNYAWTGSAWDALGASVDLSAYPTMDEADERYVKVVQDRMNPQHITGALKIAGVHFQGSGNLFTQGVLGESGNWLRNIYTKKVDILPRLETLEEQMGDLLYKAIAFTSGSVSPSVAEVGATVTSVLLKWALNKEPEALTLDGTALGVTETQKTVTGSWSAAKTWVLKATDERGATATRNLTLAFQSKAYWGVGTATGTAIDDAFVLGLSGSAFATGRGRTFSANAGAGQFIYYVFPKSWGTPVFKVGGFEGGFALDREWEHTNASGGKVQYQAWRSTNAALGQTTVVVS